MKKDKIQKIKSKSVNLPKQATVSKIDAAKTRAAESARKRFASMASYNIGFTDRMTQYDSGTSEAYSGYGDIPLYFVLMNEKNGGVLHWPINLKEKYSFYRFFYNTDAYVGAAVDLNVELPMSKLVLKMPKMEDKRLSHLIETKYNSMCDRLKLFSKLQSIMFEYFLIGNCYAFMEWDHSRKEFSKICLLPPEDVEVNKYPMSDEAIIEYRPDLVIQTVKKLKSALGDYNDTIQNILDRQESFAGMTDEDVKIIRSIPPEVIDCVLRNDTILFDTDPYAGGKIGSFVYHLARRKNEYGVLGVSILERVLIPMLMKMHLRYTQLGILSRNMTPRSKIYASCSPEELENLRGEVDASMMDPDYTVMTNYEWTWEIISAGDRLLDLSREYETIDQQIFAALGVTKEAVTGEGMYSGSRISLEIMNQRFLLIREVIQDFVEKSIFQPVAEENGFYEIDDNGYKHCFYPRLTFSRISIRDNGEVFNNLFQMYQKGSVPVDVILDLLNIDTDSATEKLVNDMFTPKDPTYNDMIRNIYDDVGRKVSERTDIVERIIASLKGPDGKPLKRVKAPAEGPQMVGIDGQDAEESEKEPESPFADVTDKELSQFIESHRNRKSEEKPFSENYHTSGVDNRTVADFIRSHGNGKNGVQR